MDMPEQVLTDKPWENEALQDMEEALSPMRMEDLKRAASSCKASTGADGVLPNVPSDLSTDTCGFLCKSGAMRLLASSGQHVVVLAHSKDFHE